MIPQILQEDLSSSRYQSLWRQSTRKNRSDWSALSKAIQSQQLAGECFGYLTKRVCARASLNCLISLHRLINGKELTAKDGVQIEKDVNNNKYVLTIPKANPAVHAGVVTIKATNSIGTVQHELNLNIFDAPKLSTKLENASVNEGQDAEFVAKFISNPAPSKIIWLKNETEEVVASETISIASTEDTVTLKLIGCKSTDSGSVYQVKIINQLGEVISNKATLNVSCGPVFVVDPADQKVLKDKEAKFECVVKSNPKPNVIWLLNGKELTNRDGVRVEKDAAKDKYTLVLPKVTQAQIGTITAKATNEFGSAEKSCQLDVLDSPKLNSKLENVTVNEGETARFVLKISGKPRPTVKWFKDDVELTADELIEMADVNEEEVSLTIKACKSPEHMGNYSAKIFNEFGEAVTNKAVLTVNREYFQPSVLLPRRKRIILTRILLVLSPNRRSKVRYPTKRHDRYSRPTSQVRVFG